MHAASPITITSKRVCQPAQNRAQNPPVLETIISTEAKAVPKNQNDLTSQKGSLLLIGNKQQVIRCPRVKYPTQDLSLLSTGSLT